MNTTNKNEKIFPKQLEFNIPRCIKFDKFDKITPKKPSYQPIEQGSLFSLKGDKE